jgi:serine/threonine-protein kinase
MYAVETPSAFFPTRVQTLPDRLNVSRRFSLLDKGRPGATSTFYKARDKETGTIVGLKILDAEKTAEYEARYTGLNKPSQGEIASQIHHPFVAETYEHGVTTQGCPYLVMEYVGGADLESLLRARDPHLCGRRRRFIYQAAKALAAVHAAGFIHRDVCPQNLLLTEDREAVKLIDFGSAVPATRAFMRPNHQTGRRNYMAPELVDLKPADQRLDIFAFGVTAYRMCSLAFPWADTGSTVGLLHHQPPRDIRECCPIHPKLARAIHACLEPNVDERCPSMEQFLEMIQPIVFRR